jgi:hypothetical protein
VVFTNDHKTLLVVISNESFIKENKDTLIEAKYNQEIKDKQKL